MVDPVAAMSTFSIVSTGRSVAWPTGVGPRGTPVARNAEDDECDVASPAETPLVLPNVELSARETAVEPSVKSSRLGSEG